MSNSSGIEVWSGSLVLTGSRSSGVLIEERLNIESTSTWIRGDRQVIDTTGKKIRLLCSVISFLNFLSSTLL
jgi:hypothetical protein